MSPVSAGSRRGLRSEDVAGPTRVRLGPRFSASPPPLGRNATHNPASRNTDLESHALRADAARPDARARLFAFWPVFYEPLALEGVVEDGRLAFPHGNTDGGGKDEIEFGARSACCSTTVAANSAHPAPLDLLLTSVRGLDAWMGGSAGKKRAWATGAAGVPAHPPGSTPIGPMPATAATASREISLNNLPRPTPPNTKGPTGSRRDPSALLRNVLNKASPISWGGA